MAMTPSQLSIIVKSQGVEKAAQDLDKLAKAAASVDSETKAFVIAQGKLAESNKKVSQSSEATARGISVQELAMVKAHEAALAMNTVISKAAKAQEELTNAMGKASRGVSAQELAMIKAHEQALKMNAAFDKQADSLKGVSTQGNIFNNTLKSMAVAATAYIGVNFFSGLIKQADAWSMMQSKLSLAVGGMENAKRVQNDLFEMSQRLRVPLEDTVKLYTRMAVPLEKMGKSTSETKAVVESFSTALKLAGATGQEASSAMLQFSQSINAGRLNGGEFNSIAEASPNVLRAIEKELVRTGMGAELASKGLKKLAADGKLTTQVLVNALTNAAPQWRKEFESLPLTVDGALERIKNAWQKAIGEIGQDTKFNQKMAESLKKLEEMLPAIARTIGEAFAFVIDNSETLITILKVLAATFVLVKIGAFVTGLVEMGTAAKAATTLTEGLTIALKFFHMTPVGLILLGIAAAGMAVYNAFKTLNKETDRTIENKRALADSTSLLAAMKAETLELMKQADAARAKIGLPAIYAKEIASTTPLIQEQEKRLIELTLANSNLFIAQKKIADYKKSNKLDTDYYVPKSFKEELRTAQERVDKIKEINKQADKDSTIQADAKAYRDAARRGEERQKLINDAKEAAKSQNQIALEKKEKALKLMKEQSEAMNLDKSTPEGRTFLRDSQIKIEREYQEALEKTKKKKYEESASDAILKHQEVDETEKLLKVRDEYMKLQDKSAANAQGSLEAAQAELAKTQALVSGYNDKKQALIDLQIAEAKAEFSSQGKVAALSAEVLAIQQKIDVLKALKVAQSQLSDLDTGKKAFEEYEKFMDSNKVDKFGKSFTDTMGKAAKAVTNVSKVLENMAKTYMNINKQQDNLRTAREKGTISEIKYQEELKNLEEVRFGNTMNLYGDMAEAAKGFFDEGTKGYKTLDGISKIVHTAQLARNLVEMGQLALKAVMNQAGGDPYTAWIRMGAMAAAMAALGFAVGGGFSSSSGGMKAADVQKAQGTGSVFGDTEAKSESIKKSLELLKSSFDKLYPVNQGMLKALKNIESSMTGLSNLVLRSGGVIEGSNMNIATGTLSQGNWKKGAAAGAATGAAIGSVVPVVGTAIGAVVGGIVGAINSLMTKTTQTIIDSGVQFGGNLAALQKGQGFNQYASVDTTTSKFFGLSKSTKNTVQTQGLSDELSAQFGLVFTNMQKSLEEAGKVLYGSSEGVTDALDSLVLSTSKISLKGLTGQALTDAINAVISKGLDEMAAAAFKSFDKYRQVGEGYAQTIMRVANTFATVNATFDKLGMKLFETSDAGIAASMAFTGLFDSLENMQSVASEYYDKFYTEAEKQNKITDALKKQFAEMNLVLPDSAKAYRELVDNTTEPEKIAMLWKLSGAFSEVFGTIEQGAKEIPQAMKDAFDSLSKDAQRWLSIRNQAASLKDEIGMAMGNPKKDPAIRMQQLWDAMSKDVTPEQKLQLAGELKDLMLQKYQVEKDSLTRLIDFGKQLRGYVDSLKVGTLSPLTMGQKLAEAQAQYQATFAKAQGGDVAAQGMLQGKADTYLQLAQTALASSGQYSAIFSEVTNGLDSLGIESMSAAEQANQTATEQLAELQRLSDFVGSVEVTANSYYNSSLTALASQITLMDAMYQKMGIFDGMLSSLAGLPAEIAAALSGKVGSSFGNDEFIRNLYQSVEGRVGSQIDAAGYNYWMKDLMTSTKEQVANNFVLASQENNQNRSSSNTSALETQIAALTAEVQGLREDANLQTGALINAQVMTSETSTAAIVSATKESVKEESWQNSLKPELV